MSSRTTEWQKSSASAGQSGCAQFRRNGEVIEQRDEKLGEGSPILTWNRTEMNALIVGMKKGEFDHLLD